MAKYGLTFIILGIILFVIGLILLPSIKSWASIPLIIGVLIILKGLSSKSKREESDNKEETKKEEKIDEEPEEEKIEDEEPEEETETEDSEKEEDLEEDKICSECGKEINNDADKCLYCDAEQ